jgi:hypothetical protein
MKIKNVLFLCLALTGFFFACRKELPGSPQSTPVFFFNGTIGGQAESLKAGINNYYMFSSFLLDSNQVTTYTGELKDRSCSSLCTNDLTITLRNSVQANFALADSSLNPGFYPLATPAGTISSWNVQFRDTLLNGLATTYTWSFGDGGSSTQHNPSHTYSHAGIYSVSLSVKDTTSSIPSISNAFPVGPCGNAFLALFDVTTYADSVGITNQSQGHNPISYAWNYGDGQTASGPNASHQYSAPGLYRISVTEKDSSGYTSVFNRNVACKPTHLSSVNFNLISSTPIANSLNLGAVLITWKDAGGNVFTSNFNGQPTGSSFQIISVEKYKANEKGQVTLKIHAKISCMLSNGASTIPMNNADVIFAIAIP